MNEIEAIYHRARGFAECAHINQKRKYTGEAYSNHCDQVARIVLEYTGNYQIAAAAHLHDVLEDTPITTSQLVDTFGYFITEMVLCVTDVSIPSDGNRAKRRAIDLKHLEGCSDLAANIKYADLISNTQSIVLYDPNFARIYLPEKRDALDVLGDKGNEKLRMYAFSILARAEAQINQMLEQA